MDDLFEDVMALPDDVRNIILEYTGNCETVDCLSYLDCEIFKTRLEAVGFTFDYGLDGIPYNLLRL
jgi:hypothetical protein